MKGVVFDLFHTLIDPEESRPLEFTRAGFSAEYFGLNPSRLKSAWDADTRRRATDGSRTMLTLLAEFCRAEGRPWPPPQDLDRYDREVGRYQDRALEHPVAGAVQLLGALRAAGFRTGLLSNAEERDCRRWAVSPLGPLFDVAHFSYDTGLLKPDLPAYQEILRQLDLAAGECAFVGDGGGGELAGARQAGFGLVIFLSGRMLAAVNPEERQRRVEAAHVTAAGFDEVFAALRTWAPTRRWSGAGELGSELPPPFDIATTRRFILAHGTPREQAEGLWVLDAAPPPATVRDAFLADQREDGGFGGIGATITAIVHHDCLGLPQDGESLRRAHGYLLARQLDDGGWDELTVDVGPNPLPWAVPGNRLARAYVTAAACLELARAPGAEAGRAVDRGLEFLLDGFRDGRFAGFWHTTWIGLSAVAAARGPDHPAVAAGLAALSSIPADQWEASQIAWMLHSFRRGGIPPTRPPIQTLVDRLLSLRGVDGSWGSEDGAGFTVFSTIESARALLAYRTVWPGLADHEDEFL